MHLDQAKRDYELFKNKTKQFIFISSASAYKKPVDNYIITEKGLAKRRRFFMI